MHFLRKLNFGELKNKTASRNKNHKSSSSTTSQRRFEESVSALSLTLPRKAATCIHAQFRELAVKILVPIRSCWYRNVLLQSACVVCCAAQKVKMPSDGKYGFSVLVAGKELPEYHHPTDERKILVESMLWSPVTYWLDVREYCKFSGEVEQQKWPVTPFEIKVSLIASKVKSTLAL